MKYEVVVDDETYMVDVNQDGLITLNDEPIDIDFEPMGMTGLYSLLVNNESVEALVEERDGTWYVIFWGVMYEVQVADERTQILRARAGMEAPDTGEIMIKAPMPGLVVAIPVEVGQEVEKGQNIVILESMKMENELKAPRDGRVERINVAPGDSVEQNAVILVLV